ncbi:hypothetical protein GOODEAATRI_004507 [Goodea atripinnis]|uniref:Uncharacterized protein n=1 Tax=Goodea atripinnis TaxID=208336 RepID=A0ABV0N8V4_9TELE
MPIVASQAQKRPHFFDGLWGSPLCHCDHLLWIRHNSPLIDHMAQKSHLSLKQVALVGSELQAVPPQTHENFFQILQVGIKIRCIAETKWHTLEFKKAQRCSEGSLFSILWINFNLPIAAGQI